MLVKTSCCYTAAVNVDITITYNLCFIIEEVPMLGGLTLLRTTGGCRL